jgi:hypothetical protein
MQKILRNLSDRSMHVIERRRLPRTNIPFAEHHLQMSPDEICKSGVWAIIGNIETKQITPE